MEHKQVVNVGDTDENADWILSEIKRKEEIAICERVAASLEHEHNEEDNGAEQA